MFTSSTKREVRHFHLVSCKVTAKKCTKKCDARAKKSVVLGCVQTDETTPNLLRQQCWELLRACWQWCTNGCNNSQQCWDLQCIVGRMQPIILCKPCVMSVRLRLRANGRNIVDKQLPTLLDVTCCVRLHTLLHVVACCCGKFEAGQTFQPTTPNISFVP